MPYTTTQQMLGDAQRGGYAVGAFNVENMEMIQAVVWGAQRMRAPVIVQVSASTARYGGLAYYAHVTRLAAQQADVPVALHIDHCESLALLEEALQTGFSSIMLDASKHPLQQNIAMAAQAVAMARPLGIPVEAELGRVGGKEDDIQVSERDAAYTRPEEAALFVAQTQISALAVAIGTAHGVYTGVPRLDVTRLSAIRRAVDIPLVLHGASGLSDDAVRDCIRRGICKVNFATELRAAVTLSARDTLLRERDAFDPKVFFKPAREAVLQQVMQRIAVCGAQGKA